MKHTPGPWMIFGGSSMMHDIIGNTNQIAVGSETHQVATAICRVRRHSEGDANARLIAAAPCLLSALQGLSEWCREHTSPMGVNNTYELLVAANDAIAKATGSEAQP